MHMGIVAMKAVSRSYFWWPGLDKDIEKMGQNCVSCRTNQKSPPKSEPHPWVEPSQPWERIHIDFCDYEGLHWLVVVDAFSRWPEIINMKNCTQSPALIREMRKLFALWGIPRTVVSDNGPQLVSEEFEKFLKANGVRHIAIPTYKPQCNGLAERMVGSFKNAQDKMKSQCSDVNRNAAKWLLNYRNTPHSVTKIAPSIRMMGRKTRSLLSQLYPEAPQSSSHEHIPVSQDRRFTIGEKVFYKDVRKDLWLEGTVTGKEGCKVYDVKGKEGNVRKHIDQLMSGIERESNSPTSDLHLPPKNNLQFPLPDNCRDHTVNDRALTNSSNPKHCEPAIALPSLSEQGTATPVLPNLTDSMVPQPSTSVRRSARVSKPPDRLNYH